MEIIGISGNPGAGKTTLANSLFLQFDTRVVHLDHILDNIKDKLPNHYFISVERESKENIKFLKKGSFYQKIKGNKYLLWLYLNSKWNLSRMILENMIQSYAKENVDYVIIEGFNLETIVSLDELDYSILVDASLETRLKRVNNRNHPDEIKVGGNPAYEDIADTSYLEKYDYIFVNENGVDFYDNVMRLQSKLFTRNYQRRKNL